MNLDCTWRVTLTPDDMDEAWPDTQCSYSSVVFRPDHIVLKYSQDSDATARLDSITAIGPRILKGGILSASITARKNYYSYDLYPDWVKRAIAAGWRIAERFGATA